MRKHRTKNESDNSGITLISLVVTIIVLIILAVVSISLILGENGIIKKAGDAKEETVVSKEKEYISLAYNAATIKRLNENIDENDIQTELNNIVGNGKTIVYKKDSNILNVFFVDTEHNYNINGGAINETDESIEPVEVASFDSNVTLLRGNTKQTLIEYTGTIKNVTYNSSNTGIATIDENGIITASSNNTGTANITATITDFYDNVITKTCILTVNMGVARTNNKDYSSIQEAINSINSTGTVMVLTNFTTDQNLTISSEKNITLDMNGKKIDTHTINDSKALILNVSGTITVENGTFYGKYNGARKRGTGTAFFNSCNIDRMDHAPIVVEKGTAIFDTCTIGQTWLTTGNGWTGVLLNSGEGRNCIYNSKKL